jgi:hypothetical protein
MWKLSLVSNFAARARCHVGFFPPPSSLWNAIELPRGGSHDAASTWLRLAQYGLSRASHEFPFSPRSRVGL